MSDERGEMTPQGMDELASAYLDGEATAQEAALVESDPRLQAAVEELRAIREIVATPVEPPSDEVRDQMIAQALDHRAPVVSLEKARRRLRAVPPQARVILAAAAVVAAIAVAGVTLFDQASRDGGEMLANDSGPAPAMADEAPMDSTESAPAPEPAAEAPAMAEESSMDVAAPASDDDMADAPAEVSEDAEEAMMADEPAELTSLESPDDESAAADMPSDDSGQAESAMDDEAPETQPTSGDAVLVFDTAADLATFAREIAQELSDLRSAGPTEEAAAIDLMGCPLFPDEDVELLTRFDAVVDEVEAQVSIYATESDLQLTETTPPPECELLNSHTFLDWLE